MEAWCSPRPQLSVFLANFVFLPSFTTALVLVAVSGQRPAAKWMTDTRSPLAQLIFCFLSLHGRPGLGCDQRRGTYLPQTLIPPHCCITPSVLQPPWPLIALSDEVHCQTGNRSVSSIGFSCSFALLTTALALTVVSGWCTNVGHL